MEECSLEKCSAEEHSAKEGSAKEYSEEKCSVEEGSLEECWALPSTSPKEMLKGIKKCWALFKQLVSGAWKVLSTSQHIFSQNSFLVSSFINFNSSLHQSISPWLHPKLNLGILNISTVLYFYYLFLS